MRQVKEYVAADGSVSYRVRFRDADKRQTSETFTDRSRAEWFAGLLDAIGTTAALSHLYDEDQAEDVPTMDDLAADHIRYRTGIQKGTRQKYEQVWKTAWSPLIGRLLANDPAIRDKIAEAQNKLADHYKHKTLKNQRGLLAGVCDRGVEKKYMTVNPTLKLRIPEGIATLDSDEDTELRLIEQSEFGNLVDAIIPRYQLMVKFLGGSGCRWGEMVVLQKKHFALDPPLGSRTGPVVRIRRALKWSPDGQYTIGQPKTKKSRRTIAIPRELVPELRDHLATLKADELVFTTVTRKMMHHRTFWSDHWRPAVWRAQNCAEHTDLSCRCGSAHPERCKVHEDIAEPCHCPGTLSVQPRIHDIRHSHASWLLAAGVPIHVVQIRLGHESIKTTVDTYGHLLPDAQIAAAEAAALVFAELSPAAREAEIQRELAGLDQLLGFLVGDDELPPEVIAALRARGWTPPVLAIEA
jgi:integrase